MNFTLRQIIKPTFGRSRSRRPSVISGLITRDDADITDLIDAAAAWCEPRTWPSCVRRSGWSWTASRLVASRCPRPPVHAITQIAYDTDDDADEIIDPSEYRLSVPTASRRSWSR